ncbi:hypothetical protein Agub_g3048, partial [Astrephomene gubernaculifera]
FDALHDKWLREPSHAPPPTSCRSGVVVHLLSEAGNRLPVRVRVDTETVTEAGLTTSACYHVVQMERVLPSEELEEKRLALIANFNGAVHRVSRPDSRLFNFPASSLVGANLCDVIDLFAEWRERHGELGVQLLLLALLNREQEMPGASWRVRVQAPPGAEQAGGAEEGRKAAADAPAWRSACLQVEVHAGHDHGGGHHDPSSAAAGPPTSSSSQVRVRLLLWRRELLSGVVEVDEALVVRRHARTRRRTRRACSSTPPPT